MKKGGDVVWWVVLRGIPCCGEEPLSLFVPFVRSLPLSLKSSFFLPCTNEQLPTNLLFRQTAIPTNSHKQITILSDDFMQISPENASTLPCTLTNVLQLLSNGEFANIFCTWYPTLIHKLRHIFRNIINITNILHLIVFPLK